MKGESEIDSVLKILLGHLLSPLDPNWSWQPFLELFRRVDELPHFAQKLLVSADLGAFLFLQLLQELIPLV